MAEKLETTQVIEEEWDKKKIALAIGIVVLLIAGFIGVRSYVLPMLGFKEASSAQIASQRVKGIQTNIAADAENSANKSINGSVVSLPTADDVQKKIQEVQNQVTHLSLQDIASSSPQVKQILQQLQALPQAPANMAKQACINLCNKL